jgi:hypothetical protein
LRRTAAILLVQHALSEHAKSVLGRLVGLIGVLRLVRFLRQLRRCEHAERRQLGFERWIIGRRERRRFFRRRIEHAFGRTKWRQLGCKRRRLRFVRRQRRPIR